MIVTLKSHTMTTLIDSIGAQLIFSEKRIRHRIYLAAGSGALEKLLSAPVSNRGKLP